jgi:hypothetical protein
VNVAQGLAGALALALGILPIAPPEHVHDAEEQGHHHLVSHRHAQPHGMLEHAVEHHSSVEDHDGPILTLTTVYTVPLQQHVAIPPQVVVALLEPPIPQLSERPSTDVDILIHGPPRAPTSPRAPPFPPSI